MPQVSFKISVLVYDAGDAEHQWAQFLYPDGRARDFKFEGINSAIENPEMPAHFWAEPSGMLIADNDNYFGNLVSEDRGLINTSDPVWQDWHYRPVKLEILDETGATLYSVVSAIDDIIPQEKSPWAKINLMSLVRRSADMPADGERAWGKSGGAAIPLYGDYTSDDNPRLFQDRTKDELTGTIVKEWYTHRDAFKLLRKTAAALRDDIIAEPDIDTWDLDTADGRRIVASHHSPEDYISDVNYTSLCYVVYDGVEYLFLGARTKLYKIDFLTQEYTLIDTEPNGYYYRYIFYNDVAENIYALAFSGTIGVNREVLATIFEYKLSTGASVRNNLEGFNGLKVIAGEHTINDRGFFIFTKLLDASGLLVFQTFDTVNKTNWAASTAYSLGAERDYDAWDYYRFFYLECTQAGTSGATFPVFNYVFPIQHDQEITDGTAKWKIKFRLSIEARRCYDIGGASWSSNYFATTGIKPTMFDLLLQPTDPYGVYKGHSIHYRHGDVATVSGKIIFTIVAGYYTGGGACVIKYNYTDNTWALLYESNGARIYFIDQVCRLNDSIIFTEYCYSNTYGKKSYLKKINSSDVVSTIETLVGLFPQIGLIAAPDDRMYYILGGANLLKSTDGVTLRAENWLYDPGGGAAGPSVPAFDMGNNSILDGESGLNKFTHISGVPLVLDDQSTDWRLFGIAQPGSQHFFIYSKKDYGYVDLCDWSDKMISDVRDYCVKRLGGLWYYDETGKFCARKRIPETAAVYNFAEGEATVLLKNSGRDKIKNRYIYIPSQINTTPCEITTVSLEKGIDSDLVIEASGIKISSSCAETALWKVSFENYSDLTEIKLYKWNEGTTQYDYVATGDRTTIFQSGYITISPDAFTGTAVVYDNFTFYVTPMQYEYQQLTYVDRTEAEDADSIDLYGIREHAVQEPYIKRVHSLDVLTEWLNMTKDPHPLYSIRYPANLVTLKQNDVITLTAAKYGLTSAKKHKVVSVKQSATLGMAMVDAEVVDINIS